MAVNTLQMGNVFESLSDHVETALDSYAKYYGINEEERSRLFLSLTGALINKSVDSVQKQEVSDKQIALFTTQTIEASKNSKRKDEIHILQKSKLTIENDILTKTKSSKIALASLQVMKLSNESALIAEEKTQLIASIEYNKKIKVLDTLGSTFGTGLAGGMVMPTSGWTVLFDICDDLSGYSATNFDATNITNTN